MLIETVKTLCALPGVSSCEDAVRDYIREEISPYADTIRVDTMGNLIAVKRGAKPGKKTLMLAAHMDEVGLMIHTITDEGYLKFSPVGGIDRRVLLRSGRGCGRGRGPVRDPGSGPNRITDRDRDQRRGRA